VLDDASVDAESLSVDPGPVGAGEEGDQTCDVLRTAESFERGQFAEVSDLFRRLAVQKQISRGGPGSYGVDRDAAAAKFLGEDVRHGLDGGLGRSINGVTGQREADHARGKIHDASAVAESLHRDA